MTKHLLCLTIDTDPDGLSGKVTNRQTLKWDGLKSLQNLPELLKSIPITWFIRADGQLESILGCATYLVEQYETLWTYVRDAGHELAWHPHLYRQSKPEDEPTVELQLDVDDFERLHETLDVAIERERRSRRRH